MDSRIRPPGRVVGLEDARRRWGARADEVAAWYWVGDPQLDEQSPRLARVDAPEWLDPERADRGGEVLRRFGLLTAAVLRCYALPLSYKSPTGVLPLVQTGSLVQAAGPRLYRTARFVRATQMPGAMHPGGPGWKASSMVRGVHASMRRRLLDNGWDRMHHGAPLPQPDLAATALLFGPVTVRGLRHLGATITADEADAVAHLARAMAHGQGVVPELQVDRHAEALELFDLLTAMHGAPSRDGQRLMAALLDIPHTLAHSPLDRVAAPVLRRLCAGLAADLLGPDDARGLGVDGRGRFVPLVRAAQRFVPAHPAVTRAQDALVEHVLRRGERGLSPNAPGRRHHGDRRTYGLRLREAG